MKSPSQQLLSELAAGCDINEVVDRFLGPTIDISLLEGINDKNIFKALIMAGGPGSGKSFVVDTVIGKQGPVPALGAIIVNSDSFFERGLLKAGLPFKIDPKKKDIFKQQQEVRAAAKAITNTKLKLVLDGMLPVVIDGTGKDLTKIKRQAESLRNLGYDVGMIFVNTSLDVALERNRQRERVIPDAVVSKAWKDVQSNLGAFQEFFGRNLFFLIDKNELLEGPALVKFKNSMFKLGKRFFESKLENPIGKNTIVTMREVGAKTISDLSNKLLDLAA